MNINTVFASAFSMPHGVDPIDIKNLAPTWGSWKTWRDCHTDNVICHDLTKARELQKRAFHAVCNFYLPQKFYHPLGRPEKINFYQGDFLQEVQDLEDIVAMHLVSERSDIVLLFGFDLANPGQILDRMEKHVITNRLGLIRQAIASTPNTQWVLVDHDRDVDKAFLELSNLTCDSFQNVLQLL